MHILRLVYCINFESKKIRKHSLGRCIMFLHSNTSFFITTFCYRFRNATAIRYIAYPFDHCWKESYARVPQWSRAVSMRRMAFAST